VTNLIPCGEGGKGGKGKSLGISIAKPDKSKEKGKEIAFQQKILGPTPLPILGKGGKKKKRKKGPNSCLIRRATKKKGNQRNNNTGGGEREGGVLPGVGWDFFRCGREKRGGGGGLDGAAA